MGVAASLPEPRCRRRRPLAGLTLPLLLALLGAGCRPAEALLRRPVPAPPAVAAATPVLWVALAARLGPNPIRLEAAAGVLELLDAAGHRHSARSLAISWRSELLPHPLLLRRQVLGPFPSYETAEQVARRWLPAGPGLAIAHPDGWEVWADPDLPPPPGLRPRRQELRISQQLVPWLSTGPGWRRLEGPLRLSAPQGLRWRGGTYRGPFRVQADAYGTWALVEQVPLERYLEGVLPHEIGAGAPAAALAAQAVLARTWALRNQRRFWVDGYHLCADTQCQVYGDPLQAGSSVRRAIAATSGRVLTWQRQPIHAVYHASNGGVAAGVEEAWAVAPLPYLRPAVDGPQALVTALPLPLTVPTGLQRLLRQGGMAYGATHPLFRWSRSLDRRQIEAALASTQASIGPVQQLRVLERGASGRVVKLALRGAAGELVLERDAIRRTLRSLPSTLFQLSSVAPGVWRFDGGGFGHGAGLSQAGAISLAARGWSAEQILSHYYPGTSLLGLAALAPAEPSEDGL